MDTLEPSSITTACDCPLTTQTVLATCHTLVQLEDLVGDPIEKAAIRAISWNITKSVNRLRIYCSMVYNCLISLFADNMVYPQNNRKHSYKIVRHFHFSSQLKRMSVLCSQQTQGSSSVKYVATVKGAAEVLKPMVSSTITFMQYTRTDEPPPSLSLMVW